MRVEKRSVIGVAVGAMVCRRRVYGRCIWPCCNVGIVIADERIRRGRRVKRDEVRERRRPSILISWGVVARGMYRSLQSGMRVNGQQGGIDGKGGLYRERWRDWRNDLPSSIDRF